MKINKNRKEIILKMNDEQAGKLIKMLITYEIENKIEKVDDDFVSYLFELMKNDLDKQIDIANRRKNYSKGRGRPKKQGEVE